MEQQAATSEILRVIGGSPADVQPVLDAVAERAARLCKAPYARVLLVDGDVLQSLRTISRSTEGHRFPSLPVAAQANVDHRPGGARPRRSSTTPTSFRCSRPNSRTPAENARLIGCRAVLAVPLVREDVAYGAIFLWRREPGLFAPDQVALVQTFARQAAIAIENVRLFRRWRRATATLRRRSSSRRRRARSCA